MERPAVNKRKQYAIALFVLSFPAWGMALAGAFMYENSVLYIFMRFTLMFTPILLLVSGICLAANKNWAVRLGAVTTGCLAVDSAAYVFIALSDGDAMPFAIGAFSAFIIFSILSIRLIQDILVRKSG